MRRTHRWGVVVAAGVLTSTVFAAPVAHAATAAPHRTTVQVVKPAPQAKPAVKRGKAAPLIKRGRYSHRWRYHPSPGHRPPRPCPYPANGTPSVSISGPTHARYGTVVTVTSKVSLNNCNCADFTAALYASKNGKNWKKISQTTTGKDGTVTRRYLLRTNTMLRIVVAGRGATGPAQSTILKVVVKK